MSPRHLKILQHSLGVDKYGQGEQYRNRFVTGPEGGDFTLCRELTEQALMKDHGPQPVAGGMHCFIVTPNGIDAVAMESPAPPKVSRSKQRYRDYLRSELNMSFGDWLAWMQDKKLRS